MNKAIIMGHLVRDPELRFTQSDVPVANFTVAVNRRFKNADGEREADFINCVAFRSAAEFVSKWFTKGRMIAVVGSIQTRKYTDKDGNNRTATEVVVDEVNFCGDKPSERQNESGAPYTPYGKENGTLTYVTRTQRAPEPSMEQRMSQGFVDIDPDDDGELPFN